MESAGYSCSVDWSIVYWESVTAAARGLGRSNEILTRNQDTFNLKYQHNNIVSHILSGGGVLITVPTQCSVVRQSVCGLVTLDPISCTHPNSNADNLFNLRKHTI